MIDWMGALTEPSIVLRCDHHQSDVLRTVWSSSYDGGTHFSLIHIVGWHDKTRAIRFASIWQILMSSFWFSGIHGINHKYNRWHGTGHDSQAPRSRICVGLLRFLRRMNTRICDAKMSTPNITVSGRSTVENSKLMAFVLEFGAHQRESAPSSSLLWHFLLLVFLIKSADCFSFASLETKPKQYNENPSFASRLIRCDDCG